MNLAIVDHIVAFGGDHMAIAANNTALKTINMAVRLIYLALENIC